MSAFRTMAIAQGRAFLRDKMLLFWTIAFPLMFLVLFGGLFANVGGETTIEVAQVGPVAVFDEMPAEAKADLARVVELTAYDDEEAALAKVRKGELDGAISQDGQTIRLDYSEADQMRAALVRGTVSQLVQSANVAISGQPPALILDARQVEDTSLKVIQYVTPGLLAWAIAMGAVFGAGLTLVQWRKSGLLRRLRLSPLRTPPLVLSRSLITLVMALVQFVIFIAVGVLFFGLKLTGSWWAAIPLLLIAAFAFQAIGLIVGAVSKGEEAASGLANLIILPMAFLSGSFFPLDAAPQWMQVLAKILPMGQLNDGMAAVMVRGQGPGAIVVPSLVLLGFALAFSLLAARLFRWDDA